MESHPRTARNGRTPAENRLYASIANHGLTREQQLKNARAGWEGRRAKIAARIDPEGILGQAERDRLINRELADQLQRGLARALTARRKARDLAARKAAADAELAEAEADLTGEAA